MMAALTVAAMTLGELLGGAAEAHAGTRVADLVLDSRDARPGAVFVAVQGGREHGLRYAADAIARGAAAVLYDTEGADLAAPAGAVAVGVPGLASRLGELAQKLYGPAIGAVELAGVTGTNGKTTVAYLAAQAMSRLGRSCGYTGTLGYGVPPEITPHALTTPDCFTLHRELAELGAPNVAMEVSSHALAQDRIAGLSFGVAAFTNLTRDHLDAHGDLERYGAAKARLFSRDGLRRAVLNVDDAFGTRLDAGLDASVEAIRVGTRGAVDLAGDVTLRGVAGLEIEISGRFGAARLVSPLIGDFNAENLLVALGMLVAWDVPLADACAALGECFAPPGRLEVVREGHDPYDAPWVVVDYAHTPDGLERALAALRGIASGELWCVFGCGGDRDRGKRAPMGRIAAAAADHVVVTDDNPRGEDPASIVSEILAGVGEHPSVTVEHDRAAAIRLAVQRAKPGDVVLIAGKGHERTQRIGRVDRPFSDRDVARDALGGRA